MICCRCWAIRIYSLGSPGDSRAYLLSECGGSRGPWFSLRLAAAYRTRRGKKSSDISQKREIAARADDLVKIPIEKEYGDDSLYSVNPI
mgnify:CR=1 FL=1